jgi:hypothetical protein
MLSADHLGKAVNYVNADQLPVKPLPGAVKFEVANIRRQTK